LKELGYHFEDVIARIFHQIYGIFGEDEIGKLIPQKNDEQKRLKGRCDYLINVRGFDGWNL
jgi:hypothetical protein